MPLLGDRNCLCLGTGIAPSSARATACVLPWNPGSGGCVPHRPLLHRSNSRRWVQVRVVEFTAATPFAEQLRVMASTGVLVSVHTSALANAVFLPPGRAVVELIHRNWVWWTLDRSFQAQTTAAGDLHHYAWRATRREHVAYIDPRDEQRFGGEEWADEKVSQGRAPALQARRMPCPRAAPASQPRSLSRRPGPAVRQRRLCGGAHQSGRDRGPAGAEGAAAGQAAARVGGRGGGGGEEGVAALARAWRYRPAAAILRWVVPSIAGVDHANNAHIGTYRQMSPLSRNQTAWEMPPRLDTFSLLNLSLLELFCCYCCCRGRRSCRRVRVRRRRPDAERCPHGLPPKGQPRGGDPTRSGS